MIIGGVDEAGRGPVIGPLVVAGVSIDDCLLKKLQSLVKDSKQLSPKRREKLYPLIKKLCRKIVVEIIDPNEIDRWITSFKGGLNLLEAEVFSRIINELNADLVYVDSCDVKPQRFSDRIKRKITPGIKVVSENKADEKYAIVSAASIVAKVLRDREIEKLKSVYGEIGSGYPSDWKTINFLKKYYVEKGSFPPFTRKSYKTIQRLINEIRGNVSFNEQGFFRKG